MNGLRGKKCIIYLCCERCERIEEINNNIHQWKCKQKEKKTNKRIYPCHFCFFYFFILTIRCCVLYTREYNSTYCKESTKFNHFLWNINYTSLNARDIISSCICYIVWWSWACSTSLEKCWCIITRIRITPICKSRINKIKNQKAHTKSYNDVDVLIFSHREKIRKKDEKQYWQEHMREQ